MRKGPEVSGSLNAEEVSGNWLKANAEAQGMTWVEGMWWKIRLEGIQGSGNVESYRPC